MLIVRSCAALVALAAALVLAGIAAAAPPGAGEGKPQQELVPVTASGEGLAPGAPEWVRQRVADVIGKGSAGPDSPKPRTLARTKRAAWYGCRTVWAYRGYTHWLGYAHFRYYQQVSWCSNGFSIYSYSRERWPETSAGWRFDGHIGSSITGGSTSRSAWTQGAFAFCVGGCYDHKYPWVLIDVNVHGGWSANAGG